jgi:alpha-glucosidase (family GH31 glycosyl hydrolase)
MLRYHILSIAFQPARSAQFPCNPSHYSYHSYLPLPFSLARVYQLHNLPRARFHFFSSMSFERQNFPRHPHANPKAIVGGKDGQKYRFTVLTKGLVRYEYSQDSKFNDLATTFAIHRDLPVPDFRVVETDQDLEIITEKFHLRYDKKTFTPSGLTVQVKGNTTDWKSLWRYGGGVKEEQMQLGGTARTLDEANGRIPLERSILATNGYGSIDDTHTMVFKEDGWIDGRHGSENIDGYLFAFGCDYKQAMKDFFAVSGHQPLLPRWSLGNWWSRYYRYSEKSYLELMDRFKSENLPFSVAVLDMDWHW